MIANRLVKSFEESCVTFALYTVFRVRKDLLGGLLEDPWFERTMIVVQWMSIQSIIVLTHQSPGSSLPYFVIFHGLKKAEIRWR